MKRIQVGRRAANGACESVTIDAAIVDALDLTNDGCLTLFERPLSRIASVTALLHTERRLEGAAVIEILAAVRYGWPAVFEYVWQDDDGERRSAVPPHDGRPYRYDVHDQAAFEALQASGKLRDPLHTGRDGKALDQRKAPAA